jgi:ubiquinone/menaquinone biosynthesis C-methylase UbiE
MIDLQSKIESLTKEAMSRENKAYCVKGEPQYSLNEAKISHEKIASQILKYSGKQSQKVLDVGCGFGDLIFSFAPNVKEAVGIDMDKGFIDICNMKKECYGAKNVEFVHSKSEKIPFEDETFDLVMPKTVLEHVEDVDEAIKEQARVTKVGGQVYVECPNYMWIKEGHYNSWMLPLMPKWLFRPWLKLQGKNPEFLMHIQYVTPRKISNALKNNGFKVRNISLEIIKDIFNGKDSSRPLSKAFLYLKWTGLGVLCFHILKWTQFYPVIIIIGEKVNYQFKKEPMENLK